MSELTQNLVLKDLGDADLKQIRLANKQLHRQASFFLLARAFLETHGLNVPQEFDHRGFVHFFDETPVVTEALNRTELRPNIHY